MCRHLCYLGPPVSLADLLLRPRHSLLEQTWAPRDMRGGGSVNADGFGVGWYSGSSSDPVRYRAAVPMWTDAAFADVAESTSSGAVLAAVRSATVGMSPSAQACAPFTGERWLFSHNGKVVGWPESVAHLAKDLDTVDLMTLEAPVDSAVVWALLRQHLVEHEPEAAVRRVVADVLSASPDSRMNLLLTDGTSVIGTTWTHSLWLRRGRDSIAVSSEPFGAETGWQQVPDRHLVVAELGDVRVEALDGRSPRGER